MKALFVHDHKLRKIKDKIYSPGGLPETVLLRYVNVFGPLKVVARIYDEEESKNTYTLINHPAITFENFLINPIRTVRKCVRDSDVVIARVPCVSGILAMIFSRIYKVPCIAEVVGSSVSYKYSGKRIGIIAAPFITFLMKILIRKSKYVIYVSRRFLQKEYPTKGRYVGVPDVFLERPDETVLKKRMNRINLMNYSHPVLGLIGSLDVSYRGQKTLMYCVKELEKYNIDAEIHFLGGGNKERWISLSQKLGISDKIFYDGIVPSGNPVFNWIDNIDVLVMPAKQETLGRAIIEAMSRGCPVVGSIETAIGEQIGSDCLTGADDYKGIADIIIRMMNDKDYLIACAKENFYRAFKYTNDKNDYIRNRFLIDIKNNIKGSGATMKY